MQCWWIFDFETNYSYGFCFDFSFHLIFTLSFLTRFCGCVYKVCFIHSKVLSLSVFKAFLRLLMFRFIKAFRSVSFGIELSEIELYIL
jgi:hypothetical protein